MNDMNIICKDESNLTCGFKDILMLQVQVCIMCDILLFSVSYTMHKPIENHTILNISKTIPTICTHIFAVNFYCSCDIHTKIIR